MQNISLFSEKEEKLLALHEASEPIRVPRPPTATHDAVEDKVRRAEEQLAVLQQKRERIEQQKQELEELGAKQRTFAEGKAGLMEQLNKVVPDLETGAEEAQRRAEFLFQMREVFTQHLNVLNTLNPDDWDERNLRTELDRGLEAIREAGSEVERFEQRLDSFGGAVGAEAVSARRGASFEGEFWRWVKLGFAAALPIMIFTLLTLWMVYLVVNRQPTTP